MNKLLASLIAAMLLGACSSIPAKPNAGIPAKSGPAKSVDGRPEQAAAVTLPAVASAREHVAVAIEQMGAGRADEAMASLRAALAKAPNDATALRLLQQIETDPIELLGPAAGEHLVVTGDTMSVLAQRYLGDPLMFYALARYNSLSAPNALSVGKVLRVPAQRGQSALAAATASEKRAQPAGQSAKPADAERASAVRLLALQSLNEGNVTRAVALLKEARALNLADPAIQKDLERAMRIQSALDNG